MNLKKKMQILTAMSIALLLGLSLVVWAQTPTLVRRAELSVPFGTVTGRIVLVADYLVFVDEDRSEDSFTIPRSEIKDIKIEGDDLKVETKRAIRDPSGERTSFSFRLREGSGEALTLWAGTRSVASNTAASAITNTGVSESGEQWIYSAKHPHSLALVPSGSCTGKLIINPERVVYESLEEREHTRQWPLSDIKKIKRKSPYKVEIEPFNREKYVLELEGNGIDITVFKKLENWLSMARSRR
jgi:hypothetical protein